MINPRKTFQESKYAKNWTGVVDSDQFNAAASAALLHMQLVAREGTNASDCVANTYELAGARKLLKILSELTGQSTIEKPVRQAALDHTV